MKIALVHPHDIENSPWTIRILKLAEGLAKRGHAVEVLYFIEPFRRNAGYRTHTLTSYSMPLTALSKDQRVRNITEFWRRARTLDILHVQKCFSHAVHPVMVAAYAHGVPIHYDWDDWEEGITLDYLGWHYFTLLVRYYERHLPRLVDSLSVSSDALGAMATAYGFPREELVKIPVGADPHDFHPSRAGDRGVKLPAGDGPLIVYAGQIEGANYAPLFLQAAALVKRRNDAVRFLVVGGGYRLPELKDLAQSLELSPRLEFTDYVNHSRMPAILQAADVCVATFEDNPVTRCKSPLKIVEYMAMGKAIVASEVGEVPFLLGDTGRLVPPGDPGSIAEAVLSLLEAPDMIQDMGRAARRRLETALTWDHAAGVLEKAYERCLLRCGRTWTPS